jgi:hypothetical protein
LIQVWELGQCKLYAYTDLIAQLTQEGIMEKTDFLASAASHVPLSDEEGTKEVIIKAIGGLWETVNELTRLRPSRRERYHVSIFGSARVEAGDPYYQAVKELARSLAEMDCNIITGGGPGIISCLRPMRSSWFPVE